MAHFHAYFHHIMDLSFASLWFTLLLVNHYICGFLSSLQWYFRQCRSNTVEKSTKYSL